MVIVITNGVRSGDLALPSPPKNGLSLGHGVIGGLHIRCLWGHSPPAWWLHAAALGCTKYARKGGVCIGHGAVVTHKCCSHEGCAKYARKGQGVPVCKWYRALPWIPAKKGWWKVLKECQRKAGTVLRYDIHQLWQKTKTIIHGVETIESFAQRHLQNEAYIYTHSVQEPFNVCCSHHGRREEKDRLLRFSKIESHKVNGIPQRGIADIYTESRIVILTSEASWIQQGQILVGWLDTKSFVQGPSTGK